MALVIGQGYGVVTIHPFGLSYYNLLVGGLPGAERLGLELTYWGDAVDRTAPRRAGEPGPRSARPPRSPRRWPRIKGRSPRLAGCWP